MALLDERWFREFQGREVAQIRKEILNYWKMPQKKCKEHLLFLIRKYGKLSHYSISNGDWLDTFQFAQEWNRYEFHQVDKRSLQKLIEKGEIVVERGQYQLNKETWSWLAALSYLQARAKESPNHFFLKELFSFFLTKSLPEYEVKTELRKRIFDRQVRFDLIARKDDNYVIGEVGGVQLWKVMALVLDSLRPTVYVLPHWTTEKRNPYYKQHSLTFDYVKFNRKVR